MNFSLFTNPTKIAIIRNKYDAFPVVKKLPVLLRGNISAMNKNIKGTIRLLLINDEDFSKYFL